MIVEFTDSTNTYADGELLSMIAKDYATYYRKGRLHRDEGPAQICPHYVAWYHAGERIKEMRGWEIGKQFMLKAYGQ